MKTSITHLRRAAQVVLLLLAACRLTASAAELRIGQTIALPGAAVSVPVTCNGVSGGVAAQFDVNFNAAAVTLAGISSGPALSGQIFDRQQLAPGQWRAMFYSPTNGPLTPGTVVWLNFSIPTNAPDVVVPLFMTNAVMAQTAGQAVQPLAQVSGALTISSAEHLTSVAMAANGPTGSRQLRTTITGLPGRILTLQGTPDLFHWANLGSYTNQSGVLVITNGLPAGRNEYLYRTVFNAVTNQPAVAVPSLSGAKLLPDGRVRFQLNSIPASQWQVEGSPDLFHWGNYGIITNPSGVLQITNTPYNHNSNAYFYRVVQP